MSSPQQDTRAAAIARSAISRSFLRLPVTLYHLGFGWLLGPRFLLLRHTGRNSGLPRHAVLEVTRHDRDTDVYYVTSGFGHSSQWFKNIQANPDVTIQVGPRRLAARARVLPPDQSAQQMVDYARRHPYAARILSRILGHETGGSPTAYAAIGRHHMPFVAFHPTRIIRHAPTAREWTGLALTILSLIAALTLLLRRRSHR